MSRALVLLVGNNPLPNLVACDYLATRADRAFDTLFLVCSDEGDSYVGTVEIAKRLRRQVEKSARFKGTIADLVKLRDPASPKNIRDTIGDAVKGFDSIHLNYTGGTKPMAVFAYDRIKAVRDHEASYLDARVHRLRFLHADGAESFSAEDLRGERLDLDNLFDLHGMSMLPPGGWRDPRWSRSAWLLHSLACADVGRLLDWLHQTFRQTVPQIIERGTVVWPEWCSGLGASLQADLADDGITIDCRESLDFNALPVGPIRVEIKEFLFSKWLESVVLSAAQEATTADAAQYQWRGSIECRSGSAGRQFEIDVLGVRGYQVFNFSCSLSVENDRLKSKGFEAAHRAVQLGGEEARAVLVTLIPESRPPRDNRPFRPDLQRDLRTDLGGGLAVQVVGLEGNNGINMHDPIGMMRRILEV